ncbi:MAG: hypothetical protein LBU92_03320 [Prevotellaceae bacterium]|jgi:hypothetical protein|nr:hypothetical protein [Prevotellaceae bacterium]
MNLVKKSTALLLLLVLLLPAKASSQDILTDLLAELVIRAAVFSTVGSHDYEDHLNNNLTDYPYQSKKLGGYISADSSARRYFRFDIENQLLLAKGNASGNRLQVKIRPFQYFYLQSNFSQLLNFSSPSLSLIDLTFCYDRLRFQRFNLGWMLGVNYLDNAERVGFFWGLNMDWFVLKPLSLYGAVSTGSNSQQSVNRMEIRARFHYKKLFYSAGYETLQISTTRHHFATAGFGVYL